MDPEADYIDNYCERLAPGLWAEPVNALTNIAFLMAGGALVWLLTREPRRVPLSVWLLPVTTALVGLCSLAFHTFATRVTGVLDSLSIGVFILIAAAVTVHHVWTVPWRLAWLAAPGVLAVTLGLTAAFAALGVPSVLRSYLAALLVLAGFGLTVRLAARVDLRRFGVLLLGTAALFAVSLTLRTLDGRLCGVLPVGTHFLWHCLNATVLFLVSYTVLRCWRVTARRSQFPVRAR